ncbi:MAG: hypothetical protein U1E70_10575 [Acetobacteraceae bacterium]|nr:hypothetical protein [Pseudomonadota bacterium]
MAADPKTMCRRYMAGTGRECEDGPLSALAGGHDASVLQATAKHGGRAP